MGEPFPTPRMSPLPSNGDGIAARYLFLGSDRGGAFVDRSILQIWGVSAAALREEPGLWLERIHTEDRPHVEAALECASGQAWDLEYRVCRPDGTWVRVHDRGRALNWGRSRQVAGLVVDITHQRRLEERLRVQAQLLDAVGEAVIGTDADGAITTWNPAAAHLFGWHDAEALGKKLVELAFVPGQRAALAEALQQTFAFGSVWSGELRLRRLDGREIPGHVSLAPLRDVEGEVLGLVALAVDVSELRAAQERVVASERDQGRLVEKLRRLTAHLHVVREQEQTRIAREVHDELGQLLTGLKLDVAWLRRRTTAGAELPAAQLGERLAGTAQLVDQALDAVRHIARQLRPPALDDLGLATAIEWLVEDFRARTGIACELRCDLDGLPSPGLHDTAAFRIVQEALTNVARHAEAGHVLVHLRGAGGRLLIDVVDDGRGVPRGALRAPLSLGILGMRERAHASGGELTVRRLPAGGTRVRARLPMTPADANAPAAESDVAAATERAAAETSP